MTTVVRSAENRHVAGQAGSSIVAVLRLNLLILFWLYIDLLTGSNSLKSPYSERIVKRAAQKNAMPLSWKATEATQYQMRSKKCGWGFIMLKMSPKVLMTSPCESNAAIMNLKSKLGFRAVMTMGSNLSWRTFVPENAVYACVRPAELFYSFHIRATDRAPGRFPTKTKTASGLLTKMTSECFSFAL